MQPDITIAGLDRRLVLRIDPLSLLFSLLYLGQNFVGIVPVEAQHLRLLLQDHEQARLVLIAALGLAQELFFGGTVREQLL